MTFSRSFLAVGLLAAALVFQSLAFSGDATAQSDLRPLLDRIDRLERDIRTLNVQLARGEGGTTPLGRGEQAAQAPLLQSEQGAVARMNVRVTALEDDLRRLTGQAEEVQFRMRQMMERLEKLSSDMDFRLSNLEQRASSLSAPGPTQPQTGFAQPVPPQLGGAQPGSLPPLEGAPRLTPPAALAPQPNMAPQQDGQQPGVLGTMTQSEMQQFRPQPGAEASQQPTAGAQPAPPAGDTAVAPAAEPQVAALPAGTPADQYRYAFGLLRQNDFEGAEAALGAFLEQNPNDQLASNARYWLGETHYVRGQYVEAAELFLENYQKSPRGPKGPDTLLKLGMSLGSLGKAPEACAAFGQLIQTYSNPPASIQKTLERERQKFNCP
ncbi:MAG: tol-pal system protein YbgF [Magnetovibrionaceae bacterium]